MCSWSDFSASFNVVIYGVSLQNIKKWAVRIDFDHEIHLLNTFQNRPFKEKKVSHYKNQEGRRDQTIFQDTY